MTPELAVYLLLGLSVTGVAGTIIWLRRGGRASQTPRYSINSPMYVAPGEVPPVVKGVDEVTDVTSDAIIDD